MSLAIKISQVGKPVVAAGKAREDLDLAVAVTLEVLGAVAPSAIQWSFVYRPPLDDLSGPSTATFTAPNAATTDFTPDNRGTYLVEVQVNQGFGLGVRPEDRARITMYAGPTLAALPTDLPRRIPAAFEQREHNVDDTIDPTGNVDGWAREWERWFRLVEATAGMTLAMVLLNGNTTGGTDIELTTGDSIVGQTNVVITPANGASTVINGHDGGGNPESRLRVDDTGVWIEYLGNPVWLLSSSGLVGQGPNNLYIGTSMGTGNTVSIYSGTNAAGAGGQIGLFGGEGTTYGGQIGIYAGHCTGAGDGGFLTFIAGNAQGAGQGGSVAIGGGNATQTGQIGGQLSLYAGNGTDFYGGSAIVSGGDALTGIGGFATFQAGDARGTGGTGGEALFRGGDMDTFFGPLSGDGGKAILRGGLGLGALNSAGAVEVYGGTCAAGVAGAASIKGGQTTTGVAGTVSVVGGAATGGVGAGGAAYLTGGASAGAAGGAVYIDGGAGITEGSIYINGLRWPLADGAVGAVLTTNGAGVLSLSAIPSPTDLPYTSLLQTGPGKEVLEPSGWPATGSANDVNVRLVANAMTLKFTLDHQSDYSFWAAGQRFTKTGDVFVTWSNTAGTHYFYFDTTGTFQTTMNLATWLDVISGNGCPVAALLWHSSGAILGVWDERHGFMEGQTHRWAHTAIGALWVSGGELSGFTISTGAANSHAQWNCGDVVMRDEDISDTTATGAPQAQTLSPLTGKVWAYVGSEWVTKAADGYMFMQSGASYTGGSSYVGANGRIAYNSIAGGVGSLAQADQGNYVLSHVFVTTERGAYSAGGINWTVNAIVGQAQYATVNAARDAASTELNRLQLLSVLPAAEMVWLGTVILQTSSAYGNTPKARVVQAEDATGTLVDYIDWRGRMRAGGGGGGGAAALASVLLVGNTTSGTDLNVSNGDLLIMKTGSQMIFESAASMQFYGAGGFVAGDDISIYSQGAVDATTTGSVILYSGTNAAGGGSGKLSFYTGSGNTFSGNIELTCGLGSNTGGSIVATAGAGIVFPGDASLTAGAFIGASGVGGTATLAGGDGAGAGNGGDAIVTSGAGAAGGNVLLKTGGTTRVTVSPLLVSSTLDVAIGTTPAAGGAVRIANNAAINARDVGNTSDITLIKANASDQVEIGNGTTVFDVTSTGIEFASAFASPKVYQADETANSVNGDTLTIQGQNSTGTTTTGGGVTVTSGTGTTAAGNVLLQTGGTTRATVAPTFTSFSYGGSTGTVLLRELSGSVTYGAVYLGVASGSVSGTNYAIAANGTDTLVNAPTGTLYLRTGGNDRASLSGSAWAWNVPLASFNFAQASPIIRHDTDATATITGDTFLINAQDCSGTTAVTAGQMTLRAGNATGGAGTRNGGKLLLQSGTGATADGDVEIQRGATQYILLSLNKVEFAKPIEMTNNNVLEMKQACFNGTVDNGNSGTTKTIDWTAGNKQKVTMTGNCTFTFTAPSGPASLTLECIQDAGGSKTGTFPAAVLAPGGKAAGLVLSTTGSATDVISMFYDGTNYYAVISKAFAA